MSTQISGNAFNDFHCVARVWSLGQLFPKATLHFTSTSDFNEAVKYDPRCFLIVQHNSEQTQVDYNPLSIHRAWVSPFGVFLFGRKWQQIRSTCFFVHRASPQIHLLCAFLKRMSAFEVESGVSLADYARRLHVLR